MFVDGSGIAIYKPNSIASVFHYGNLLLDLAPMPHVVSIERCNKLAMRLCDSQIAGSCHSFVRLSQENDPWILVAEALDYGCGVVGGPIVDNNDLKMGVSLYHDRT